LAQQTGIVIRRNHRGGQTIQQLSIPLLTGHHQNLLQGELPRLGQKTDGLTAGRALGKNIQEPMATELGFRLQTMAAQALTGQTNQTAVGST
jgi:predicted flavoprotein YhiN